jgi:hypothetical protein
MRIVISVGCVLACALSLEAQITATLNHSSDGSDVVRIRNDSAISLVTFVVTVGHALQSASASKAPFVVYSDPVIEPTTTPIPASGERVVMVWGIRNFNGRPIQDVLEEPIVAAGILADGATIGDASLLSRLIMRRSNMLLAVDTTLETLSDAGRRNITPDQLIKQFDRLADSLNHWYLPPEQQIGRDLYLSMAAKLRDLPEGQVGAAFPPASFVAQESALLRQQRATLLESEPNLLDATPVLRAPGRNYNGGPQGSPLPPVSPFTPGRR